LGKHGPSTWGMNLSVLIFWRWEGGGDKFPTQKRVERHELIAAEKVRTGDKGEFRGCAMDCLRKHVSIARRRQLLKALQQGKIKCQKPRDLLENGSKKKCAKKKMWKRGSATSLWWSVGEGKKGKKKIHIQVREGGERGGGGAWGGGYLHGEERNRHRR